MGFMGTLWVFGSGLAYWVDWLFFGLGRGERVGSAAGLSFLGLLPQSFKILEGLRAWHSGFLVFCGPEIEGLGCEAFLSVGGCRVWRVRV